MGRRKAIGDIVWVTDFYGYQSISIPRSPRTRHVKVWENRPEGRVCERRCTSIKEARAYIRNKVGPMFRNTRRKAPLPMEGLWA